MPVILAFYPRDDSERRRAEEPLECCGVADWPQEKLDCERKQHPDAKSTENADCSDKRPIGPVRLIWNHRGFNDREALRHLLVLGPHASTRAQQSILNLLILCVYRGEPLLQLAELLLDERRLGLRSEEHTSELQSLMRISYAVFCLKKKNR